MRSDHTPSFTALSAALTLLLSLTACGPTEPDTAQAEQASTPATIARLSFLSNWHEVRSGELRQGSQLILDYDLQRLPQCRGTHNGHPAWDTQAHLRFAPGGQLVSASVRRFVTNQGVPTTVAESLPLEVTIPEDATSVAIYFQNYDGAGGSCSAWDSEFGANYRYAIWPPASHARCKDIERWETMHSDMPYKTTAHCLDYDIDANYDANHCELYLSAIGHGYMAHYGIPNRWVEATIEVSPQEGEVLGVGVYTRYRDKESGAEGRRITFGRQIAPHSWQTGMITLRTAMMGQSGFAYDIDALAFFVDIRRASGEVVRLWQSRGGANYTIGDAFALPTSTRYIPYGNIQQANSAAPIFDARQRCMP